MALRPNVGKVPPNPPSPKTGPVPDAPLIPKTGQPRTSRWSFSFRFWKQIEDFGCASADAKWFVSLLERLRLLSDYSPDGFRADKGTQKSWRYHKIDWAAQNIPIARKDLDWISKTYLDNEEEYPLVQLQVSMALGRIVGFWDENVVFNVVLLDRMHNIQPSSYSDHRIRPSGLLSSEYSELLAQVDEIKNGLGCERDDCKARVAASRIPLNQSLGGVMVPLTESDKSDLQEVLKNGWAKSIGDVLATGIVASMDQGSNRTPAATPPSSPPDTTDS